MQLRFHEEDWQRLERDWTLFWQGELTRPMMSFNCYDSGQGPLPEKREFIPHYGRDMSAEAIIAIETRDLERRHFIGDSFPKFWPNFGPGSAATYLGSKIGLSDDTVWFEPVGQSLKELDIAVNADSFWYKRIQSVMGAALEIWSGEVQVGFSDIGGNLDILASLRGTNELLFDLYDCPDRVEELSKTLTRIWADIYADEAQRIRAVCRGTTPWAPIWSTGTCYMLQSDFSYMISPAMFESLVLPDLAALCEQIDNPFYHLDGKGELPHLDLLLSLDKLKGVQWIPGDGQPPADEWPEVLKKIRKAGKLCQLFVSAEGARHIVKEFGGAGFALEILDSDLSPEEAKALFHELS